MDINYILVIFVHFKSRKFGLINQKNILKALSEYVALEITINLPEFISVYYFKNWLCLFNLF
jgi:hypothetical protein